ncbi:MAG: hypothetical protein ABL967_01410 [Bryobacteraceae bacterium]
MAQLTITYVAKFKDGPVVLATMDHAGAQLLKDAFVRCRTTRLCRFSCNTVVHTVQIEEQPATITIGNDTVQWRLSLSILQEIIDDLDSMMDGKGHHYVNITSLADTLVLSVNEYAAPEESKDR